MIYVNNFKNWIDDNHIIDFLISVKGDKIPVWQPERWKGNPILDEYREKSRPGYSKNTFFFHQINPNSQESKNFNFVWPNIEYNKKNRFWWFVILYPGEFQTIHVDPHLTEIKNFQRFTMFLQDWEPGHIFVYDDKILTNYKAGDLYEWNDAMCVHGPANIGFNTRYTLQMTLYDDKITSQGYDT